MILILAEAGDTGALWLQAALRQATGGPAALLTPARLVYARTIAQHMATDRGWSRFALGDGTTLDLDAVTGVVNRMTVAPSAHLARAGEVDRIYALAELHAFLLGWLAALRCPVINPPSPESLAGPWHSEVCALHFAATSGLACRPASVAADRPMPPTATDEPHASYVVLDDQVIGPLLPATTRDAMIQFARLWGARLVQIETAGDGGAFLAASSLVDFPRAGPALVRALGRALAS